MSNAGNQPYTPTLLQWITLQLNAMWGVQPPVLANPGFTLSFRHDMKDNTIVIKVSRKRNIDDDLLDMHLELVKGITEDHIADFGLDSQIGVEVSITFFD